jgi:hypothetical protein
VMTRWQRAVPRRAASVLSGVCPGRWLGPLADRWAGRLDLPALTAPEPQVSGEMYLAARTGTDD